MSAKELWAKVAKKYPVHEETLKATEEALKLGPMLSWGTITLEETRRGLEIAAIDNLGPFDGEVKEIFVPSPHVKDGVPVTIYKPANCPSVPVIIVYYHGGGLVLCSRETHESCSRLLSSNNNAVVVSVGYRLLPCPEDPLAPFNDAMIVTKWVLENKEIVGGSAASKVGAAGDSAGGQITCSVTNDVQGLDFQILIYPVTDLFCNLPSFDDFRDIPMFNTVAMESMFRWSELPIPEVADNPRVNPSARKNLESSPPTLIILAQLDPLRDWGLAYSKKLKAAGVRVEEVMFEGVPHGFFSSEEEYPTNSCRAHECITKFITSLK